MLIRLDSTMAALLITLMLIMTSCEREQVAGHDSNAGTATSTETSPSPQDNRRTAERSHSQPSGDSPALLALWISRLDRGNVYPRRLVFAAWDDGIYILDAEALCDMASPSSLYVGKVEPSAIEGLSERLHDITSQPRWDGVPVHAYAPDESYHKVVLDYRDRTEFRWAMRSPESSNPAARAAELRAQLCAFAAQQVHSEEFLKAVRIRLQQQSAGLDAWIEGEL